MSAAAFACSHIPAPSYAVQPSSGWTARPLERRRSQSLSAGGSSTSSGTGGSYTGEQKSDSSSISSFTSMSSAGSALSRAGSHGSWRSSSSGGSTGSIKTWDGAYGAGVVYGGLEGGAPDHGGAPLYSSFSALPTYAPPFSLPPSSSSIQPYRPSHPARSTSTLHASPIPPSLTSSSPIEDSKRSKRANFTSAEVERLQATWDRELYYPSMELVAGIMQETGLTRVQIRNW